MISVVEAYVDILSASSFRENVPTGHDVVRRLVENAEFHSTETRSERMTAFADIIVSI
jgi:hypothetical protein